MLIVRHLVMSTGPVVGGTETDIMLLGMEVLNWLLADEGRGKSIREYGYIVFVR